MIKKYIEKKTTTLFSLSKSLSEFQDFFKQMNLGNLKVWKFQALTIFGIIIVLSSITAQVVRMIVFLGQEVPDQDQVHLQPCSLRSQDHLRSPSQGKQAGLGRHSRRVPGIVNLPGVVQDLVTAGSENLGVESGELFLLLGEVGGPGLQDTGVVPDLPVELGGQARLEPGVALA